MKNNQGQQSEYFSSSTPVFLATSNPTKAKKLRQALEGISNVIKTPSDIRLSIVVEETGVSHREIAETKALRWSSNLSDHLVISTDGGVLIPCLGSLWLSIYTGRFVGEDAHPITKIESLLSLMKNYSLKEREVTWIEALAVAHNGHILHSHVFQGATGELLDRYDSRIQADSFWLSGLLFYPQYKKVYRDLSLKERSKIEDPWSSIRNYLLKIF